MSACIVASAGDQPINFSTDSWKCSPAAVVPEAGHGRNGKRKYHKNRKPLSSDLGIEKSARPIHKQKSHIEEQRERKQATMVDLAEFLCFLSCFLAYLRQVVRKYFLVMDLSSKSPGLASPAPALSWKRPAELAVVVNKRSKESSDRRARPVEDVVPGGSKPVGTFVEQVSSLPKQENVECEEKSGHPMVKVAANKMPRMRGRPARIAIPKPSADAAFAVADEEEDGVERELEVEGGDYCVISRKGHRHMMEDGYGVISNIHAAGFTHLQAFFGVFDGHGGRAAVDFVSEKLGKNIVVALDEPEKEENKAEMAIKAGYLTTDRDFLTQVCGPQTALKHSNLPQMDSLPLF
ncbi:hypothetical protein BHM03_00038511 [Ensete ventricosum]|nr:hypothetical protein BHM03_00038511 [Ensete ventricosum]